MRESKGNMYTFVTHTWNPVIGKCSHDCEYCYMKRFPTRPPKPSRLVNKVLKEDLGKNNFIFVCSGCDLFAEDVPAKWIEQVLDACRYYDNKYLFQSKNPGRILEFKKLLPPKVVIGTTIESNKNYPQMGLAPGVVSRANDMKAIKDAGYETMVTIEPIMDFDMTALTKMIESCKPSWVNIGADSKGHQLPEPDKQKIIDLIKELERFTVVKQKSNLKRIFK